MMVLLLAAQAAVVASPAGEPVLTLAEVGLHKGRWPYTGYYPDRAMRAGVSAQTTALCRVAAAEALVDCRIEAAQAVDYSFDQATLKLLAGASTDTATRGGAPTEGRSLRVSLSFTISRNGSTRVTAR
ncbi:hypothetical protein SGCZBJ_10040 [Caulobacter zeae]|uniref:TonB C-terminal domain-containing protein n=1 Tax=Caulobacter zeae TaxID=2055137 RepID=A0A2N5DKS4_9CAUL|nr:hypothetical protein [Caulobacter zeae]PLR26661.1 hypothetical protein SGCZBJ_10040 [Caulobacter zeae]